MSRPVMPISLMQQGRGSPPPAPPASSAMVERGQPLAPAGSPLLRKPAADTNGRNASSTSLTSSSQLTSSPPLSKRSSPTRLEPIDGILTPEEIRAKIERVESEAMTREQARCEKQRRIRLRELKKLQRDQEHHFSHFHRLSRLPVLDPTWRQ